MFLRKHIRHKDGKRHVYWSLVETYRTARGPRQRTVAYLGELTDEVKEGYRGLSKRLNGKSREKQGDFFEALKPGEPVSVYPDRLRVERVRDFGNAWVGFSLWRALELGKFFEEHITDGKASVCWSDMICYVVVSRFCEPTSELAIAERLSQQNALCDILGIEDYQINDDRLYRTVIAVM